VPRSVREVQLKNTIQLQCTYQPVLECILPKSCWLFFLSHLAIFAFQLDLQYCTGYLYYVSTLANASDYSLSISSLVHLLLALNHGPNPTMIRPNCWHNININNIMDTFLLCWHQLTTKCNRINQIQSMLQK